MVVEVVPELEQFIFEVCGRPEQRVIQILASNRADEPFDERMRQGNAGDALDFCHLQNAQIGLPLMELIKPAHPRIGRLITSKPQFSYNTLL